MGGVQDIQIVPKAAEVRGLGLRGRRIVPRAPVRGAGGGPPGGGGIGVDRNPYAVDVSSDQVQTMTKNVWDQLDLDNNIFEDTAGWTVDLVNDKVTQDVAGPVVLLGQMTGSNAIFRAHEVQVTRNTVAVPGTDSAAYGDQLSDRTAHCVAMVNGSASDEYQVEFVKRTTSTVQTNTFAGATGNAGGLTAFFAPNDVLHAYALDADLTLNTTWQDLPLTAGDNVGTMSLASNEITLDETADYLIIAIGVVRHIVNGYSDFEARLVVDTGGGYSAIPHATFKGIAAYGSFAGGYGAPIRHGIIYAATSGDKIKIQLKGDDTNQITGPGSGIVVLKLPDTWQGLYAVEATPAGNYSSGTAYPAGLDTVVRSEGGFALNGNGIQCPSSNTTCLVMGTVAAFKNTGTTYQRTRAMIYRDPGGLGSPARVDQANAFGQAKYSGGLGGYSVSMTQQIMSLTANDIMTLQALQTNSAAHNGAQFLVLRLDNLTP